MPTVAVEIEVWCAECGEGICDHVESVRGRDGNIKVRPCDKCMKEKDNEIEKIQDERDDLKNSISELEGLIYRLNEKLAQR